MAKQNETPAVPAVNKEKPGHTLMALALNTFIGRQGVNEDHSDGTIKSDTAFTVVNLDGVEGLPATMKGLRFKITVDAVGDPKPRGRAAAKAATTVANPPTA